MGAHIHAFGGDAALAEEYANRALRLSPFDHFSFEGHIALGGVRLRLGRYAEAAESFAQALQAHPRFSIIYMLRASALALAGRIEEAQRTARQLLELEPTFCLAALIHFAAFAQSDIRETIAIGARQAGLPD